MKPVTKVYRLWIEWDFGQDGVVFATEALAKAYLKDDDAKEVGFDSVQGIFDEGLASIEEVELINE